MLVKCRALHVSGTEDLLLYLASSDEERQFAFHVLEIISLMFREQVKLRDYCGFQLVTDMNQMNQWSRWSLLLGRC